MIFSYRSVVVCITKKFKMYLHTTITCKSRHLNKRKHKMNIGYITINKYYFIEIVYDIGSIHFIVNTSPHECDSFLMFTNLGFVFHNNNNNNM